MKVTKEQFNEAIIEACKEISDEVANNKNNFLHEYRPHTYNNGKKVSINEVNAKTLLQRHSGNGYIVISPCHAYTEYGISPDDPRRDEKAAEENNKRIRKLIVQIKNSGYSYTPVYGGFIEGMDTDYPQIVYERSFVIYNQDRNGNTGDIRKLFDFGVALSKEYNQDSFLFKSPDNDPQWITKDGKVESSFKGTATFNDYSQEFFTDLHKNTQKYKGQSDRRPTRFSFTEAYINPAPQCYPERVVRAMSGEVFLTR